MKSGAILIALCACLRAQDASLEGLTVDSSTGRPLAGVHLTFFSLGPTANVQPYGAQSDSAGRFSIARIAPGSYFYVAERAGYLAIRKGARGAVPLPSVIVKSGERVTDHKVELTPRATISGRVFDEYGDPVQNVEVQLTPAAPDDPVVASLTGADTRTDDRGEYSLPAVPGAYRVRVRVVQQTNRSTEVRTDGTSPAEYVPTEYPGAVEVAAGAEIGGIDIRLSRRAPFTSSVEGTVTGIPDSRGWAEVHLVARESSFHQMTQTSGDGRFTLRSLQPGRYRLFARYTLDSKTLVSQTIEFTDASPPSGVVLRLAPAPEVSGTLVFDGGELPPSKRTVTLRSIDGAPNPSGDLDGAQSFRFAGVFPGRYRVVVRPLPENAYVRAAELDGAGVVPEEIEITGPARLKITIGRNAAQITGNVVDKDGVRVENTLGAVLLIRDMKKPELTEELLARLSLDGSYTIKGLRPAKYWLLAVDAFRSGDVESPGQLKKLAELAEPVELKEGDRLHKDLKLVTREAIDAKAK